MEPAPRKIFAGPRLKRLRRDRHLTQAGMASELDVSPSYLNLMERNQRPITVQVLIRLNSVYGVDPRDFMGGEGEHSAGEIEQILADPLFRDAAVPRAEVHEAAENSPALVAAMARLYRAYAAAREASEAGVAAGTDHDRAEPVLGENPLDRIRAIQHETRNHFPGLEEAAEAFAAELALTGSGIFDAVSEHLRARHGIRVRILPLDVMSGRLRWYDHHRRQLMISEAVEQPGRTFQAAYQLALIQYDELLNDIALRLEPNDGLTRRLLRITLANYFAGALMMPYGSFLEAAELAGYDVELLAARFGASFEQVAHRLTTLARPTARGVPFFLIRVDMAGNVSKRFSSSRFPFAHSGGTCALWNIHAAFTEPGRILTQVIELPDGSQWFSIARTVRRSLTPFGAIEPHFAIGLGCEIKYAKRLIYAKRLDLNALDAAPIGINCRLCDRPACPQRAAPPAMRPLIADESTRGISPFTFREV
ncbi:MAG: short-chain fatty acyl-CoA regulator family protein [Beijerinckiaceae bacterium]|nr:short-chain fatty acyl-CoA regulator family protein [Beijerinckiaceae bacterium]MCI0736470.1 short-chain fatty acyl-CoA regulator family protein [Beijerinckiaceae bacterium]